MTWFGRYILKRIATAIVLVALTICFTFFIFKLPVILWRADPIPHSIADELSPCLRPPEDQVNYWFNEFGIASNPDFFEWIYMFGKFIAKSFTGQFGISLETHQPIFYELMKRFPTTLLLLGSSVAVLAFCFRIRNRTDISITKLMKSIGWVISAIIIFEVAFNLAGVGRWFFWSIIMMDYPVAQACFIVFSGLAIIITLIFDIIPNYLNQKREYYKSEDESNVRKGLSLTSIRY
jgi:ABC-type dipeptide/oligopeptide/nickel transport system permease component